MFRPSRKIVLIVSCLLGILSGIAYMSRLSHQRQAIFQMQKTAEILVAAGNIAPGDYFHEDNVDFRRIRQSEVHKRSLVTQDIDLIIGQQSFHAIPAGDPIMWNDLTQTPRIRFPTEKIPSGFRAMALQADEVRTLSHLINPGDYVDIVWTGIRAGASLPGTEILAQKIEVMAVGSSLAGTLSEEQGMEIPLSVTIVADEKTCLKIINHSVSGEISFLASGRDLFERTPSPSRRKEDHGT